MHKNENAAFFRCGFDLAIENAVSLMRVSKKASETKDFGIACSLNILAAEELLKAYFLKIKQFYPNGNIPNFEKIFHSHPIKHQELDMVITYAIETQKKNLSFLASIEPALEIVNKTANVYKSESEKYLIASLNEDYIWLKSRVNKNIDFGEISAWLKYANSDKNKGLYVDKKNNEWFSPKNISETKFDQERKYTEAIFDYVISVQEVFLREEKMKNFR